MSQLENAQRLPHHQMMEMETNFELESDNAELNYISLALQNIIKCNAFHGYYDELLEKVFLYLCSVLEKNKFYNYTLLKNLSINIQQKLIAIFMIFQKSKIRKFVPLKNFFEKKDFVILDEFI